MELNENDNKLLGFCMDDRRSVSEIAKFLKISPKNVSVRLKKLKEKDLIRIERKGVGKKTFVRTKKGDKTNEHFVTILKEIVRRGGEVTEEEYSTILPFNPFDIKEKDRFSATLKLPYVNPPLIERVVRITPEGKKLIKKFS